MTSLITYNKSLVFSIFVFSDFIVFFHSPYCITILSKMDPNSMSKRKFYPEASFGGLRVRVPKEKKKRKKKKKKEKKKKEKEKRKREKRKKGTMNIVKLLHIKCCFFQFFNSPVALKNKKILAPRKSWNDAPDFTPPNAIRLGATTSTHRCWRTCSPCLDWISSFSETYPKNWLYLNYYTLHSRAIIYKT